MKAKINKSNLMKRAWNIYRGNNPYSGNFSTSLSRAWEVEKAEIAYELKQVEIAQERARREALESSRTTFTDYSFMAGAAMMYDNARDGQYFGD